LLTQRQVEIERDRAFILDLYCLRGWEDLPQWARNSSYYTYKEGWMKTDQPKVFLNDLKERLGDERTIAEIWEEDGKPVAFMWVVFDELVGYRLTFAEVRSLVVSTGHQRRGIGGLMLRSAEEQAKARGAISLRSEMATDNEAACAMHGKQGFTVTTYQYEKVLVPTG
jgi:GNAT superfamily N-acetyltransferase